jgi:hypothetical protein
MFPGLSIEQQERVAAALIRSTTTMARRLEPAPQGRV